MKASSILAALSVSSILIVNNAVAAQYTVQRTPDQPVKFETGGVQFNENSSLIRESIVLNNPDCPIQVNSTTSTIINNGRNYNYRVGSTITAKINVSAVSIRHIQYDVFGRHMVNLANVEIEDWGAGEHKTYGIWSAYGDQAPHLLTTVTYISRVRLADGTQWDFDESELLNALGSLKLEKLVAENKREP